MSNDNAFNASSGLNPNLDLHKSPLSDSLNFGNKSSSIFEHGNNQYSWGSYEVQLDDTLSGIAKKTLGDASAFGLIADYNHILDPNKIFVGQGISVPIRVSSSSKQSYDSLAPTGANVIETGVGNYQVKAGDTLSGIAQKVFGDASAYEVIAKYNNISDPSKLYAGQQIQVPQAKYDPLTNPNPSSNSLLSVKDYNQLETGKDKVNDSVFAAKEAEESVSKPLDSAINFAKSVANNEEVRNTGETVRQVSTGITAGLNANLPFTEGGQKYVLKQANGNMFKFEAQKNGFFAKLPKGINSDQFAKISADVREGTKNFSDDPFIQGSRASGISRKTGLKMAKDADIDIGLRVDSEKYKKLLDNSFPKEADYPDRLKNLKRAETNGIIRSHHASDIPNLKDGDPKLKPLAKNLVKDVNKMGIPAKKVDLAVIKDGGKFDNGTQIKLATKVTEFAKPVAKVVDVAGKIAKPVAIAADFITVVDAVNKDGGTIGENTGRAGATMAGEWAGGFAGATVGMQFGALAGSAVPVVGTAAGALVGGVIGGVIGSGIGSEVASKTFNFFKDRKWW